MSKNHNPFIVIEALDAGGSQTQTDRLAKKLQKERYRVHQYHFPQEDTTSGRLVYDKYLFSQNKYEFTKREQALLYIQDFFSRVDEMRAIQAKQGKRVIISDRYYTSTLAYQTAGLTGARRQRTLEWIRDICLKEQPKLLKPDLVILLDTPVNIALKHLANKKKDFHENSQKLTSFRNSYLRLASDERWTIINSVNEGGAQRSIQDIHQEIWQQVSKLV